MKSIARDLNVRRVPSPGSSWHRSVRRKDGYWLISTLVEAGVWGRVQQRLKERATGQRVGQPRRYLLSGLRREHEQAARGFSPAAAAIGTEIADLESLIVERPARAATLRATIEDLRQKQANLQRAAWRRATAPDLALPAEDAYRAAVSDINGALRGNNVEAARAALRGLLGNIPVFQEGRHLAARLTMNPAALLSNPGTVLLVGSGGVLLTNSTTIVSFPNRDLRGRNGQAAVPN